METYIWNQSYVTEESGSLPSFTKYSPIGSSTVAPRPSILKWAYTLWALALHCVLSLGVILFLILYVKDRSFSINDRQETVQTIGGRIKLPFSPTQSDIVTVLSSLLDVLKWALTCWMAALCWRTAFFLMERHGLARRDFEWLVKYQVPPPISRLKAWSTLIIATLLLTSLAANLSSPIVTGAISWVPMNTLAHGLPTTPIIFSYIEEGLSSHVRDVYMSEQYFRDGTAVNAGGLVNTGWGRDPEKGIYKRIDSQVQALATNSTIENVTLPYFQVHSLEWVKDLNDIPDFQDHQDNLIGFLYNRFGSLSPSTTPWRPGWSTLLVPNANWSDDPIKSISITDRRLLVCQYWSGSSPSNLTDGMTPRPPVDAYLVPEGTGNKYHALAWVNFSAGVGRCENHQCSVSSPSTIRNNSRLELAPHPLTFQALALAPAVSFLLESLNFSIPFPWQDTEAYIEALLVRSYSGAWTILNEFMQTNAIQVNYVPSFPASVAAIQMWRVYAWLGLQLLVTFLSGIFLLVEYDQSQMTLIIDASLTPFFLDTSQVRKEDNTDPLMNGTLRIQEEDDVLRIWKQA